MKNLIHQIFQWVLRVGLLLAGMVFFASLMVVAVLLLMVWLLSALWARLSGRPVAPWVFRVGPRAQWNRFNRGAAGDGRAAPPGSGRAADLNEVTDVVAREIAPQHDPKEKAPDRSV